MLAKLALCAACVTGIGIAACGGDSGPQAAKPPAFSNPTKIDNPYLPLTKFKRCEMRGQADDGTKERSVKTVQPVTKPFDVGGRRVEAVVIKDDAYEDGALVESTLDYYAQADDGTVHYLGEDVKNIKDGRVVDTQGSFRYGRDTDVLGVAMPPDPQVGDQYRFEDVPGITIESNRVEERGLRAEVQGRIVTGVIRIQEFIQPEGDLEYKTYAPGLGVIAEYPPGARVEFAGCRR